MKEILIFAGTTEGRKLAEHLAASGIPHTLCVATEYGEIVLKEHPLTRVHRGRMSREEIQEFIARGNFAAVVDATHPYAEVITENIRLAMQGMELPYFRLKRETREQEAYDGVTYFDSNEVCARALEKVEGNILLTTGSKELYKYCVSDAVKQRLYVRVLPGIESIRLCMEQGIGGRQLLALQGPFTTELNEAILHQYRIKCLVTKESGRCGGYREKLEAAARAGIPVFVIGNAHKEEGDSFRTICQALSEICEKRITLPRRLHIVLAGVGMGASGSLTGEVRAAIENADVLLGAERMLADYQPRLTKKPYYRAEQIIPYLKELQEEQFAADTGRVVVLFSGDSGFYSGCHKVKQALQQEIDEGGLDASLTVLPGISSVSCLAACIGEDYQDAAIYSMHGKPLHNLVRKIRRQEKTFLLMSGVKDVNRLGRLLVEAGLTECRILAGYMLSYPEQQIKELSPEECCALSQEGLYTCYLYNPKAECRRLTHGRCDGEFIREKVPMTKEEVREVSICKLKLRRNAVVYDIGSGTGSIAVEIAGLSDSIQVYAVEQKEEAVLLIEKNKEKFQLDNISVISAAAPEGLSGLPAPTHAFIGGSGGRLKDILSALYQANPGMRVVINAISLETICEIKEVLSLFPIAEEELVQMQVNRARKAGNYHLMQAENPVWICAFRFCGYECEKDF